MRASFKMRVLGLIKHFLSKEEKKLRETPSEYRKRLYSSKIALLRDLYDDIKAMDE